MSLNDWQKSHTLDLVKKFYVAPVQKRVTIVVQRRETISFPIIPPEKLGHYGALLDNGMRNRRLINHEMNRLLLINMQNIQSRKELNY